MPKARRSIISWRSRALWYVKRKEKDVRDKGALQYDANISRLRRIVEPEAIFRRLQMNASDLVLDIGTGTGRFLDEVAENKCFAVGIDFSRLSLIVAKRRCNCEVVLADLCYLPFRNQSFHKEMSVSVLQHVPLSSRICGLSEIRRVSKKGSKIVFTAYNYGLWQILKHQAKEGYHNPEGNYFHRFNFAEIRTLFESIGFKVESINGIVILDGILRAYSFRKLNLSRRNFTPWLLKAMIAMERIIECISPLSFLLGDHLLVVCRVPN